MPRKKPDNNDLVIRQKEHDKQLLSIMQDVRLHPNRRLLAEMLSLCLDAKIGAPRDLLVSILVANFGSPDKLRWTDKESGLPAERFPTGRETEATDQMRSIFDTVLNLPETQDATSQPG